VKGGEQPTHTHTLTRPTPTAEDTLTLRQLSLLVRLQT